METTQEINGNPAALSFDRAVDELRRGRAVHVTDGVQSLVFAAIETVQPPLFERLVAAGGARAVMLVTAERAHAAGLSHRLSGAVSVAFPAATNLEALRALAGVAGIAPVDAPNFDVDHTPPNAPLAAASFQLAKAGRLVPALVGFDADANVLPGVLTIAVSDVAHHAPRFGHHALQLLSRARVPLAEALECEIAVFRDEHSLGEHVAVVIGKPDPATAVPVRLHSACLTGDLLGSLRCDCGEQLRTAVA
ncbi:MAG TPA: GTP cyclohydrolase, partial [Gammaproteobacteria bacterium]|nr:GTP cyclohydrolase [Gammaproteobacteria bacterium]